MSDRRQTFLHHYSSPKNSIDAGRMISTKPVSEKVPDALRDNLDPDLNPTEKK
jgi:hypothetical protein